MATKFKIHPGIGIARVGDSTSDFYLAPEGTGDLPIACDQCGNAILQDGKEQPVSQFKDSQQRVMRQGARFRVYIYDDKTPAGRELKIGDQITVVNPTNGQTLGGEVTDIQWTVYLANKKASWYEFQQLDGEHGYDPAHPLRNADITDANARQQLIIDPGPQTVAFWDSQKLLPSAAQFAQGQNPGYAQSFPPPLQPFSITTLGELKAMRQNGHDRLVVLGGYGCSGSMQQGFGEPHISAYANNDGWFDDVSDGPVSAQIEFKIVTINGAPPPPPPAPPKPQYSTIAVDVPAWAIVGYPRYAPQIVDIITMDDLVYDVSIRYLAYDLNIYGVRPFDGNEPPLDLSDPDAVRVWRENATWNTDYYPRFCRDIWPILSRPNQYQYVMDFEAVAGGDPHNDTPGAGGNLDPTILSQPPAGGADPDYERRQRIYKVLRKPGQENLMGVPTNPGDPNYRPAALMRVPTKPGDPDYQPAAMPLLCGDNPLSNTVPAKFLRLTDTQLFLLKQWADGKFINEHDEHLADVSATCQTPANTTAEKTGVELDRGVLGNLLGGSFCPGGEAGWIMRNPAIYSAPYRIHASANVAPGSLSQPANVNGADTTASLKAGLEPGDLTKYSAQPWQSDFNECSTQPIDITYEQWNDIYPDSTGDPVKSDIQTIYWWPSHRPMGVLRNIAPLNDPPNYVLAEWSAGIPGSNAGDLKMVSAWKDLGFVLNTGTEDQPNFVEVERNSANL